MRILSNTLYYVNIHRRQPFLNFLHRHPAAAANPLGCGRMEHSSGEVAYPRSIGISTGVFGSVLTSASTSICSPRTISSPKVRASRSDQGPTLVLIKRTYGSAPGGVPLESWQSVRMYVP